ncbi:hypothetical protein CLV49_2907 [Labedella gwakjiensis]|uniref:YCII-related domain-containing protein n=1 Tax=Labedella gwakjiensis TaxID=390269 RepID=A0A2P8GZ78_9MICO|nr:YciI family protein [Labedella gwakjiensis]PSL39273.1 hypothetical protein CLV49_2907 [Labedella gwakjiensis]RUQ86304.1 hypothetical protein ELQ93_04715 [Labedella gwakjiensis]
MTKYLMLKHYRGPKDYVENLPPSEWAPGAWDAHVQYMDDFADRLRETGEFVSSTALAEDGVWVRFDGQGRPPVTDGPFAETKDLVAGWMMIDVDSYERALELAGELSAAPGAGGEPLREWLELRPVMEPAPTVAD